jgi:hypothetical protein
MKDPTQISTSRATEIDIDVLKRQVLDLIKVDIELNKKISADVYEIFLCELINQLKEEEDKINNGLYSIQIFANKNFINNEKEIINNLKKEIKTLTDKIGSSFGKDAKIQADKLIKNLLNDVDSAVNKNSGLVNFGIIIQQLETWKNNFIIFYEIRNKINIRIAELKLEPKKKQIKSRFLASSQAKIDELETLRDYIDRELNQLSLNKPPNKEVIIQSISYWENQITSKGRKGIKIAEIISAHRFIPRFFHFSKPTTALFVESLKNELRKNQRIQLKEDKITRIIELKGNITSLSISLKEKIDGLNVKNQDEESINQLLSDADSAINENSADNQNSAILQFKQKKNQLIELKDKITRVIKLKSEFCFLILSLKEEIDDQNQSLSDADSADNQNSIIQQLEKKRNQLIKLEDEITKIVELEGEITFSKEKIRYYQNDEYIERLLSNTNSTDNANNTPDTDNVYPWLDTLHGMKDKIERYIIELTSEQKKIKSLFLASSDDKITALTALLQAVKQKLDESNFNNTTLQDRSKLFIDWESSCIDIKGGKIKKNVIEIINTHRFAPCFFHSSKPTTARFIESLKKEYGITSDPQQRSEVKTNR